MSEPVTSGAHPAATSLVLEQTRYAFRGFWRTPIAAFFTIAFPVLFIIIIGLLAGDAVVDEASGVRVTQFATPGMMAFAVAMASFSTPAIGMAIAREQGVLKRLRGTPLPAWAYLAGRVIAASGVAMIAVALMIAVAALAFDVQLYARTLPQAVGVLLLAATAFASLAFAVVALIPSSAMVQVVTTGSVTTLGFISDIFLVGGELPRWLQGVADVFPLRHLAILLRDAFHPFATPAFGWDHLAVLTAWGVAGAIVAVWRFSWQPAVATDTTAPAEVPGRQGSPNGATATTVLEPGRPGWPALLVGQMRYATISLRRDAGAIFFAILFPVLLVLLFPAVFGEGDLDGFDLPFIQVLGAAMTAYGVATHAFVTMPEQIARARDAGVLKRLRGTPLPSVVYLGGRLLSGVAVAVLIAVTTLGAAALAWGMDLPVARLPVVLVVLVLGTVSIAALGILVATLVPNAQSVPAVSLGLLLPLAFVSDVFAFGPIPDALQAIGWAMPLKHFVRALLAALDVGSPAWAWSNLAVLGAWGTVGVLLAARRFRWDRSERPRRSDAVSAAGAA